MEYYGYIYLTLLPQGSIDGIPSLPELRPFYFGQKKGKVKRTYFGSGTSFLNWAKKEGLTNSICINPDKVLSKGVERYILCYAHSEKELNELEHFFVDPALNTLGCINRKKGGKSWDYSDTVWTQERKINQGVILQEYNKRIRLSNDFYEIKDKRRTAGLALAEWAKLDKSCNPEKYKQIYTSNELREKFSDVQIIAWEKEDTRKKHIQSWTTENRQAASVRESIKWDKEKRAERSLMYREYKHWTNGTDDVYQKYSPGPEWVPARMGTKKACKLLGIELTEELKKLAAHYFIQKRRKKLRKHNK
jgi:hypothetical protein